MVGLAEVVLDVVVLGRDAQLNELPLECPALLKEAVYFAVDGHSFFSLLRNAWHPSLAKSLSKLSIPAKHG